MNKLIYTTLFLSLFISNFTSAQKRKDIPPEHPVLVIGIVVEDMRYDYLYRFWNNFGEGGFKKLIDEGTLCKNANYNYMLTQTAPGFATMAAGCEPVIHGIVSDNWYQRIQKMNTFSVFDAKMKTIGVENDIYPYAPTNLLTTTFTDELKLFNNGKSKIIGISFKPESAILSAGHLGDAAYWFDDVSGKFITSSYYCDSLPAWVNTFNDKKFPDIYIERDWLPLLSKEKYREGSLQGNSNSVGFASENKFAKRISSFVKKNEAYAVLKATPFGITLTKDFAISAILDEELGKDVFTDYINIGFASTSRVSQSCGPNSIELEDLYIRLDRELEHFLQFIDDQFGKQNVLIYLTSDHGAAYDPQELKKQNIPAGQFNAERAIMLLGTYMNAVYDKGKWISAYHNKQIYLNHRLIEDSELKLSDVQDVVAQFIIQFTGVANAMTSTTLEQSNFSEGIFGYMQNSYNQKRSGDVIINLEPAWIEKGEYLSTANSANKYDTHVPLMWYGWKIKRSKILRTIYMKDIAPTIANFLDIPFPNGCTGNVITELN
ncbi:MAG: alkaline phosphatase family protein [Salinivirgaceae bacterium]|jgi:predicted AlkP superfamily pyrophosphatase or phosphodiesterase|nr:alkaline phosphatase family protein [Salinivirgaceae bacterium]